MRKALILLIISVTPCLFSCSKKSNGCSFQINQLVAPVAEQQQLKAYLDSAGISAVKDSSGFYFQLVSPGTGKTPGPCSQVTVSYVGKLTNGAVFDHQNSYIGTMGAFIPGWEDGLQLVMPGGEIRLYIPPSLGYGNTGANSVPPNSILIFDINLLDVQ